MHKWSPTMIRATKGCSRQFQKKFVEEAPVEVNIPEFEEGKRFHELIERYLITGNETYIETFNDAVKETLRKIKSWQGQLYIEKEFEDELITGVADIVFGDDNKWVIIDIKSKYDSDITQDEYVQLYTYAYFLQKENPKNEIYLGILAVHNQFSPLNLVQSQLVTFNDLRDYVKHQIELAEKRIKHMRINTSYCKYCEYVLSCDAITEKPTSIEEMAQRYLQLKNVLNQLEIALREHVNLTGRNIEVDGIEIGMHIKNVTKIDEATLVEIAKKNNIPLHTIFKPDVMSIKKIAKKIPDINNAIFVEQDYYFTAKKIKDDNSRD